MTHSARDDMAASVISPRDGSPVFTRPSSAAARRLHLARADLWAGDVHQHADTAAELRFSGAHMGDHLAPMRRIVMPAVDAHGVGTVLGKAEDHIRIIGRFGVEGYEDGAEAPLGRRPEQGFGVPLEPVLAAKKLAAARHADR
jgi:hypothetical protein